MNSITKHHGLFAAHTKQKPRLAGHNSAMKASAACIARWEDDGGRPSASAERQLSLIRNATKTDERRSVPPIANPLMTFALSFWRHAADETFLSGYRKVLEGIDGFGWHEARLRSSGTQ